MTSKKSVYEKTLDELNKQVRYKCDNCGAVNNYTISYHRDVEPIYTHGPPELPSHYFFRSRWVEVHCNNCGADLDPRAEDIPPRKEPGIYSYYE